MIKWILKPLVGVGPFRFGIHIQRYKKKYGLFLFEEGSEIEWDTYKIDGYESQIYFENNKVISVGCFDSLFYKGRNLFGLTIDEIRAFLGKEDSMDKEEYDGRVPVEYEELDIQVWYSTDKRVDSVMCYGED